MPNLQIGFFVIGVPLACICICTALMVTLLGAYRFWRQQSALARGKIHAGGWEVISIFVAAFLVH